MNTETTTAPKATPSGSDLADAIRDADAANTRLVGILRALGVATPAQAMELHLGDGWNCITCGETYPCPTTTAAIDATPAQVRP